MPRVGKDCGAEKKDDQPCGGFSRLMQRVHSLEDLLKLVRWERTAVQEGSKDMEILNSGYSAGHGDGGRRSEEGPCAFQMPLHYPRFSKEEYESMPEWRLDLLFQEYGLAVTGDLAYKRNYAVGAFVWPDEY